MEKEINKTNIQIEDEENTTSELGIGIIDTNPNLPISETPRSEPPSKTPKSDTSKDKDDE